ncbi:MAG: family 1 glycosylhydrolase [Acidimicrobiales bacterium]
MPRSAKADLVGSGFLFGVATAGYQVEGGYNGPGEPANNWVRWERSGRVEPSGVACDFWRQPEEALDRAADLGCNAFRLSVEWARLEPESGVLDGAALDRYVEILEMCTARGLAPVVTLHHFTHPWWLGEEFWLTPGSPDLFAAHVARIVPLLVDHCRHWITVNEPNILALMGWVAGATPPGRRGAVSDAWAVVDNLLTAHVLARRAIRAVQPDALVSTNTSASTLYDYDRVLVDLLVARSHGVERPELDAWVGQRRALHNGVAAPPERWGTASGVGPGVGAGVGAGVVERVLRALSSALSPYGPPAPGGPLAPTGPPAPGGPRSPGGLRSRLRRSSPRRVVDEIYSGTDDTALDAVGFDWYDPVAGHAVRFPGHRTAGGRNREPAMALWDTPADPARFTGWCAEQHELTPGLPLWVVENGMATRVRRGRAYPRDDGWDRARYVRRHVAAVVDAVDRGAPVTMYMHWSLVDNYEWGSYEPRFGLYGMDRSRGPRGVRWLDTDATGVDAAGEYRRVIAACRAGDRSALGTSGGVDRP